MLSLLIMGEYDDMKHLVRDGSKKLRDASELPDGTLFSVNKTREGAPMPLQSMSLSSPRKRMSPGHFGGKQPGSHMNMAGLPQSTPPKLRSHPRDRQGNRRQQIDDRSAMQDVGAHAEEKHQQGNDRGEDGDWSNALGLPGGFRSIWTCGGTVETSGTVSPTQVVNQRGDGKANAVDMVTTPFRPVFDGRDSGYAQAREPGATPRA